MTDRARVDSPTSPRSAHQQSFDTRPAPRLLIVLTLVACAAAASLVVRSPSTLVERPFTEDGFYALSIARNIAAGHGITIDGVTRTNGFQPLHTFLIAGLARLTSVDRLVLLRVAYAAALVIFLVTAWLVASIARDIAGPPARSCVFWATALVYVTLRLLLLQHFNGLETGLQLLLIVASWRLYQRAGCTTASNAVLMALLLGLTVLARLDMMFLLAGATLLIWFGPPDERPPLLIRIVIPVVAFLVALPWLVYSHGVSGTLIPTSGLAQQAWGLSPRRWLAAVNSLAQVALPFYAGAFDSWGLPQLRLWLLPVAGAAAVVYAARRYASGDAAVRRSVAFGAVVIGTTIGLMVWYAMSSWATHFYVRYFAPALAVSCIGLGSALARLCTTHPRLAATVGAASAAQAIAYAIALHAGVYAGRSNPQIEIWSRPIFQDQLRVVEANVPGGDAVAAGQSGTLGYFRDRVVNVDGKVNPAALAYQQTMLDYFDREGIRWFCDIPPYVDRYLGARAAARGWREVAQAGIFHLYHRDE
jgi:hypothetical protein